MKQKLIYTIIVLFALTTSSASSKGTPFIISKNSKLETEPSAPNNFYLWCLLDHQVKAPDFYKYVDRFEVLDNGNTHFFQAYPGDWCYRI